jgi:hypothetical protein
MGAIEFAARFVSIDCAADPNLTDASNEACS